VEFDVESLWDLLFEGVWSGFCTLPAEIASDCSQKAETPATMCDKERVVAQGDHTHAGLVARRCGVSAEVHVSGDTKGAPPATSTRSSAPAFDTANTPVRSIQVRSAQNTETQRKALLEICATVVVATPYNEFNTD
jgi:hypothetical protein